jgi:putative transposase
MSTPDRRARLDPDHSGLSMRRQCTLLGLARSGVYRRPTPANDNDLALMRRIDAVFMAWPFLGSRRITALLRGEGEVVNRKRVRRLTRRMGIAALGPKPRTTRPAPGHEIFPCLLRELVIDRPNQVWAELAEGFADEVGGRASGGRRYHPRPDRPGLPVSGRDHGLAQPGGAGLAAVEHHGP